MDVGFVKKLFIIIVSVFAFFKFSTDVNAQTFDPNITISPDLDISLFSPYKIEAENIPELTGIDSVSVNVSGINGNDPDCWDYYVSGLCASTPRDFLMTWDNINSNWATENVYPDMIYPEIFFASSNITWNNIPQNINVRRNDYHLLHFNNSFNMVEDMSFWIEINAVPNAVNSSNLDVYLVKNNKSTTFFNSDWRNSNDVELVGTLLNSATFHHSHNSNSSHHLIPLSTNADGTVGNKNLDISGDFWIILYSQSPNVSRSWNLRYHPSTLCNQNNLWYRGNQQGWTTVGQSGCPDSHIHIARRSDFADGVKAILNVNYLDESTNSKMQTFSFAPLPNIAPTSSSFVSPLAGTYSDNLRVEWTASNDANGSPLTYSIDLYNNEGTLVSNLVTDSPNTFYDLDTNSFDDGVYYFVGEVCDDGAPLPGEPLCTNFQMNGTFTISNADPIYSISSVSLTSSRLGNILRNEDTLTLSFVASGPLTNVITNIYSAGVELVNEIVLQNIEGNFWTAVIEVSENDLTGQVTFDIVAGNLDSEYIETTDDSYLSIDNTPPSAVVSSYPSGNYNEEFSISLQSLGSTLIRYTLDNSSPTCEIGEVYFDSISISDDLTVNAIACDEVYNSSPVSTFIYTISPEQEVNNIINNINNISGNYEGEDNFSDDTEIENIENLENNKYITEIYEISGISYLKIFKIKIIDSNGNHLSGAKVNFNSINKFTDTDINGLAIFYDIPVTTLPVQVTYKDVVYEKEVIIQLPKNNIGELELDVYTIVLDTSINDYDRRNYVKPTLIIIGSLLLLICIIIKIYKRKSN